MNAQTPSEGQLVESDPKVDTTAMTLLARAEIDGQIATAHAFPRSMTGFLREATELVSLDAATAESCIYSLPRGKDDRGNAKMITGASVRFAEIILNCFGNNRSGGRVVSIDKDTITAQGVFHDLEKNVQVTKEVSRRIVDSRGKRYNADMIGVTGNAAISIALRNAILAGIPQAIWGIVYERAKDVAIGDITTLSERRAKAIAWFGKVGISPAQIAAKLDVEGIDDIGLEEMEQLVGLKTAISSKTISPEEAFAPEQREAGSTSDLAERVEQARQAKAAPKEKAASKQAAPDTGVPTLSLSEALTRLHGATTRDELDAVAADFPLIQLTAERDQAHTLYDTKIMTLI